jgi:hypothetical protein
MVESGAGADGSFQNPLEAVWRLAPGVWPQEGRVAAGRAAADERAYTLIMPSGRRFELTEPLYRLAELLEAPRAVPDVAARLGERLGRPISPAQVAALIDEKLADHGVAIRQ